MLLAFFDESVIEADQKQTSSKPFLNLKTCKFNIKNNTETIFEHSTSFIYKSLNKLYTVDKNTTIGFSCENCNRKIATSFLHHDCELLYILTAEGINCNCEQFVIKNIIE